jgi:cytidylate kinase
VKVGGPHGTGSASTLTGLARAVVLRLNLGRSYRGSAVSVGMTRSEMERVVRVIRTRVVDWRPSLIEDRQRLVASLPNQDLAG